MQTIRIISAALVAASAFAVLPASAQTGNQSKVTCVNVKDIKDTTYKEGDTITFRMTNGTTLVNHLISKCSSLKFGGFTWVTAPGGDVCAESTTLRAHVTGEICRLGKFDAPVKAAAR